MDNKIRNYKVVFANGVETSVTGKDLAEVKRKVWEVWRAFWWNEPNVLVERVETGKKWVGEKSAETGWWPKWKEVE